MKKQCLLLLLFAALPLHAQTPPVQFIQQRRLEIEPGQYSGITPVGEDVYAVVHDKAQGGGLYFFTLSFLADGSIGPVTAFQADAGGPKGRDNEDVVYVPENQTLFVSAEGDQSIREYTLDGRETGRKLKIPEELTRCKPNGGFEALAYADGRFWTTTEFPLPAEKQPRMHRIQSFRLRNLAPAQSYLYQTDEPLISEAEAASARAYVFGISGMTALPDGRLVVMEREVFVPGGDFFDMVRSFTHTSLFLITPGKGKPLEKTLLTSFYTSFLNLANYEGICLGPVLADGRQTLLLLADSQDGSNGLTFEYIQVIAF